MWVSNQGVAEAKARSRQEAAATPAWATGRGRPSSARLAREQARPTFYGSNHRSSSELVAGLEKTLTQQEANYRRYSPRPKGGGGRSGPSLFPTAACVPMI